MKYFSAVFLLLTMGCASKHTAKGERTPQSLALRHVTIDSTINLSSVDVCTVSFDSRRRFGDNIRFQGSICRNKDGSGDTMDVIRVKDYTGDESVSLIHSLSSFFYKHGLSNGHCLGNELDTGAFRICTFSRVK
ncbi:MAG: hypothetical protein OXB88_02155 [Bacteriovoracales bacterium]|nr:hypothetical protein [Bacteriovoracales bacterium]